jgi:hypothetical protein
MLASDCIGITPGDHTRKARPDAAQGGSPLFVLVGDLTDEIVLTQVDAVVAQDGVNHAGVKVDVG